MTNRETGDILEERVRRMLREGGVNLVVRDSSSGSARRDGDGMNEFFFLSCKFRSGKSFTLSAKDYQKDKDQAARFTGRKLLWALGNSTGDVVIMMKIQDFIRIIGDEWKNGQEEKD
jgi:Holliday junction resolvase